MREIKFRVWDNDKKQMLYQEDNTTRNSSVMECQIAFDELGHCVFVRYYGEDSCFEIKNTELMQYTGLKDKNGVEIFEGDIIKLSYLSPLDNKEKVSLYRVEEMQNGYYAIKEVTDKQRGDSGLFLHFQRCEVVGNIYENPELLEGEKK